MIVRAFFTNLTDNPRDGYTIDAVHIFELLTNNISSDLYVTTLSTGGLKENKNTRIIPRTTIWKKQAIIGLLITLLGEVKWKFASRQAINFIYIHGLAFFWVIFLYRKKRIIFNLGDSPSLRFRRIWVNNRSLTAFFKHIISIPIEYLIIKFSDSIILVSVSEVDYLQERYPNSAKKIRCIPVFSSIVTTPQTHFEARERVLIFADLSVDYLQASVVSFLEKIEASDKFSEIDLLGQQSELVASRFGLNSYNFIPDLSQFLKSYAFILLPDLCGSGIKTRAVFSMKAGCCVVASKVAIEGIPVVSGRDYIEIPEAPDARWFGQLFRMEIADRNGIGESGQRIVGEAFNNSGVEMLWADLFSGAVGS
jgi:hypothetical protein